MLAIRDAICTGADDLEQATSEEFTKHPGHWNHTVTTLAVAVLPLGATAAPATPCNWGPAVDVERDCGRQYLTARLVGAI